jgi:hypothetical protein
LSTTNPTKKSLTASIYFFLKNEVIFGMVRMTWFNLIPYLFNEYCLFSNSWFEHAIVKALSFSTKNICCISRFTQIMHTKKMHESTWLPQWTVKRSKYRNTSLPTILILNFNSKCICIFVIYHFEQNLKLIVEACWK